MTNKHNVKASYIEENPVDVAILPGLPPEIRTPHRADRIERYVEARCPDGSSFSRDLRSLEDLRD